jgi:cell division protein FtsL
MAGSRVARVALKEGSKTRYSSYVYAALVFMVIALLYVWCHLHITDINYKIAEQMKYRDHLVEENRKLKVEIGALRSPRRIERIAKDRLKMQYPERAQVVFLK